MMDQMETKTPLGRVGELLEVDGGIQEPNLDLGLPDLS